MKDTVYFIGMRYNKLVVGELPIEKETEKLYYLSRTAGIFNNVRILKKNEENIIDDRVSWTTELGLYGKLKRAFVVNHKQSLKGSLVSNKEVLRALIKDAKVLGIRV